MIIDKVPQDTREDFDIFSFAGRVSLLGGTAYAGYKTAKNFDWTPSHLAGDRSNRFNQRIAENLKKYSEMGLSTDPIADINEKLGVKFSFGNNLKTIQGKSKFSSMVPGGLPFANMESTSMQNALSAIKDFTGVGEKNFDRNTADILSRVIDKHGSSLQNLDIKTNSFGDIGQIELDFGKGRKFRVSPSSKLGQVYGGSNLSTVYSSGGFLVGGEAGKSTVLGPASYALEEIYKAKDINDVNFNQLKQDISKLIQYDSDERVVAGTFARSADELSSLQVRKAGQVRPAPWMSKDAKENIDAHRRALGGVFGGEKHTAEGAFYIDTEYRATPVKTIPSLRESINASQLHRSVQIQNLEGVDDINKNFLWGKEMTFSGDIINSNSNLMKMQIMSVTDPEIQSKIIGAMNKRGIPIEQLTKEGIILDSAIKGDFIGGKGSLNFHSEMLGETMDNLIKTIAATNEMTIDEVSMLASQGGLNQKYFKDVTFKGVYDSMLQEDRQILKELTEARRRAKFNKSFVEAKELANQINKQRTVLRTKEQQFKNLGIAPDGRSLNVLDEKLLGTRIRGLSLDPANKQVKVLFDRVSNDITKLKLYSGEGNLKREAEYSAKINEILDELGINRKGSVQGIIFQDALPLDPRSQKLSRSAAQTVISLAETAAESNNSTVLNILSGYGIKQNSPMDIAKMESFDWRNLFRDIGEAYGETTEEAKISRALSLARSGDQGLYTTYNLVGLGEAKIDLGVGKFGTLSSRQLFNIKSMGLDEFANDLISRRSDGGLGLARMKELRTMRGLEKSKTALAMGIDSEGVEILKTAFNVADESETYEQLMKRRSEVFSTLEKRGWAKDGRAIIDLGKNYGNKRIVVSNSQLLSDYIGLKHGTYGGNKSLTDLEYVISNILNNPMNKDVMNDWINRYDKEMGVVERNFADAMGKAKIKNSMYGKFEGYKGMGEVGTRMSDIASQFKGQNVVFMNDQDILKTFGQSAQRQAREMRLFGMLGREPAESIFSTMPTRIVSTNVLGRNVAKSIARNSNKGTIFIDANGDLLQAMFGDFDGDKGVVMPFLSRGKQLEDFVTMKPGTIAGERAMMVQQVQRELAQSAAMLKGRSGVPDYSIQRETRDLINRLTAEIGKGSIGQYSNEMSKIHAAMRSNLFEAGGLLAADPKLATQFIKTEATSHLLVENILKAKYMDLDAMKNRKPDEIMDFLTGKGINKDVVTVGDRAKVIEDFFDEMVTGDQFDKYKQLVGKESNIDKIDSIVRSGFDNQTADEIMAMKRSFSNQENLIALVNAADSGQKLGTTNQELTKISKMMFDEMSPDELKKTIQKDLIKLKTDDVKKFSGSFMKNFGMAALVPAAAIGLMGSVLSGPGEMEIEGRQFSDEGKASIRANNGAQYRMQSPKYQRQPEVRGLMSQESNQFMDIMNNQYGQPNIHLADHRANMDKYEIDELVQRGY